MAPEQVRVLTVSEKSESYGRDVERQLLAADLRVSGDYRAEKLGSKIRDAEMERIPYVLVVGEKDMANVTVSVRDRLEKDLGAMKIDQLVNRLFGRDCQQNGPKNFRQDSRLGERGANNEY